MRLEKTLKGCPYIKLEGAFGGRIRSYDEKGVEEPEESGQASMNTGG